MAAYQRVCSGKGAQLLGTVDDALAEAPEALVVLGDTGAFETIADHFAAHTDRAAAAEDGFLYWSDGRSAST